ncbi:MAG: patatin-like phospholipase family protein [Vitreoscilla sp.]
MTKRSLMLAGGGMKVAFQAGVLQVWLDEAGIAFDHVDGASGGCLNLAMLCQGMTGKRIADNWRTLRPIAGVSFNLAQYQRLFFARSIFTLDGYRAKVFPSWGLDWPRIAQSPVNATFNAYNFSKQQLEIFKPGVMTEDHLCACISLPMWFPPVDLGTDTYIDAVYVTDCNLEEAIDRGADEIWVIWTVGKTGKWNDGFVNNYFQIIEAAANGRFEQVRKRIQANNAAILAGGAGEFGRHIELKVLSAEVDLNYIFNFSADRVAEAVDKGVAAARTWCLANGITPDTSASTPLSDSDPASPQPTTLQFSEVMKGFIERGATDCDEGERAAQAEGRNAEFALTIRIDDIDHFVSDPLHQASVEGTIESAAWRGRCKVRRGTFNLLVDGESPDIRNMWYRLFFVDDDERPLTLVGRKDVRGGDATGAWTDTTTLFVRVLEGDVAPAGEETATVIAAGIVHIHPLDFLRELDTFKATGPTFGAEVRAMERFGTLFLAKLWDVYARQVLPASPF